ncbi:hypothetical protein V1512DRAFT_143174, partial [Lipomyces arxii]|uniref:uncharacterized protein n=1 Tax=Lipomyces arxii TaxID=56418 RepID=UPI0034CF0015
MYNAMSAELYFMRDVVYGLSELFLFTIKHHRAPRLLFLMFCSGIGFFVLMHCAILAVYLVVYRPYLVITKTYSFTKELVQEIELPNQSPFTLPVLDVKAAWVNLIQPMSSTSVEFVRVLFVQAKSWFPNNVHALLDLLYEMKPHAIELMIASFALLPITSFVLNYALSCLFCKTCKTSNMAKKVVYKIELPNPSPLTLMAHNVKAALLSFLQPIQSPSVEFIKAIFIKVQSRFLNKVNAFTNILSGWKRRVLEILIAFVVLCGLVGFAISYLVS